MECARHRVDYDLAYAILITESMQRPRWFRLAERITGSIGLSKTHGIMQSSRDRRVTDESSVSDAISKLSGAILHRRNGQPRNVEVEYQLERHNEGVEFGQYAAEVFWMLSNRYVKASSRLGTDGSPAVRIFERSREGRLWKLTGDVSAEIGVVILLEKDPAIRIYAISIPRGENEFLRREWVAKAPISLDSVFVVGMNLSPKMDLTKHADQAAEQSPNLNEPIMCTVQVYL